MISRIALAACVLAGATGAVLAVRSERAQEFARRTQRATSDHTRSQASRAAERIDLMIHELETSEGDRTGTDWRYQALVGARDALVSFGQSSEAEPVGASSNGSVES